MNNPFHGHQYLIDRFLELSNRLDKVEAELEQVKVDYIKKGKPGATSGSYRHIDEVNPRVTKNPTGHVVQPKTPQKLQWDEEQKLKEENEKFRISPR
jgi:hypothetical protein